MPAASISILEPCPEKLMHELLDSAAVPLMDEAAVCHAGTSIVSLQTFHAIPTSMNAG